MKVFQGHTALFREKGENTNSNNQRPHGLNPFKFFFSLQSKLICNEHNYDTYANNEFHDDHYVSSLVTVVKSGAGK